MQGLWCGCSISLRMEEKPILSRKGFVMLWVNCTETPVPALKEWPKTTSGRELRGAWGTPAIRGQETAPRKPCCSTQAFG